MDLQYNKGRATHSCYSNDLRSEGVLQAMEVHRKAASVLMEVHREAAAVHSLSGSPLRKSQGLGSIRRGDTRSRDFPDVRERPPLACNT